MKWRRTPYGYLSADGRWFLERGGMMTHGCNAWLVWEQTDEEPDPEGGIYVCRPRSEVTGLPAADDEPMFLDSGLEGGWLSEVKFIVEQRAAQVG